MTHVTMKVTSIIYITDNILLNDKDSKSTSIVRFYLFNFKKQNF
jgi:hypothetical protein